MMNAVIQASTSSSRQYDQDTFDPADGLLGTLHRVIAEKLATLVYAPGIGAVAVVPDLGDYLTELSGDELAAFCRVPATGFTVKRLGDAGLKQLLAQGIKGRNLDELKWCAAFHASQGRLMKGCGRDDVVLLKTWPNLTRLPAAPNGVRIAALLTRHPTTVALAHRLLKIPVTEMNEFYSAATAAGLAIAVNRKPEQPREEIQPHRQRSLLGALFERVMGL
jgi:hypothetical protein